MKNTFGIIVAGRGIFPASLIAAAKEELFALLDKQGMDYVILPADATPTGAVQTMADAEKCAELFRKNSDKITGIIVCMPNFGEEAPIYHSIKMSGLDVPVLIQACDDDDDKLSLDDRRDSFCGKISVCNNLYYGGIKYSLTKLHTCPISSPEFAEDLDRFDRVCAVVYAMRHARVGLIGMRPDNFRTVRFSEKCCRKTASPPAVLTSAKSSPRQTEWMTPRRSPPTRKKSELMEASLSPSPPKRFTCRRS